MIGTSKYCSFYVVRHGESEWNRKKLIQGHFDSPLTIRGEQQALALAEVFRSVRFDAVFSSDLHRAKKTAEIISRNHKLKIKTSQLLRERDFGQLEGKSRDKIKLLEELYDKMDIKDRHAFRPFPDMESDKDVIGRFYNFIRKRASQNRNKNILIVTHIGIIRILLRDLGFARYKERFALVVDNTAYVKLLSDGKKFIIEETKGIKKA